MTSECDTERDRYDTWPASEIDRLARRLKVLAEYAHARQASAPATGEDTETRAAQVLIAHQRLDIGSCLCGWGVKTGQLGKCHSRHVAGELAAAGVLAVSERHELCPAHPAGPLSNVRYRCLRCEIERLRAELASVAPTTADRARATEREAREAAETSRARGFQARVLSREIGEWRPSEHQPNVGDRVTAEHYARPGQLVTGCWHGCAKFADQEWLTDDDGVDHYIKAGTCVHAEEADDAQ